MKEKLYTIPLNDAVNASDECPFCFIERELEQNSLDFVLGNSSSYMESDIRDQTDKAGFCRVHMKKMFDYGNTLGNALILQTHYHKLREEMRKQFDSFSPGKSSVLARFRRSDSSADKNPIAAWTAFKDCSCFICRKLLSFLSVKIVSLMGVSGKKNNSIKVFDFLFYARYNGNCFFCSKSSIDEVILHVYNY